MRFLSLIATLALTACGLPPAPYQTYAPATPAAATAPKQAQSPLVVYGTTTTTPDTQYDFGEPGSAGEQNPATAFMPPAAAPATPAPPDQRIAICYSRLWNSADSVRSAALQACGGKGSPRVVDQGIDLDACPLLTPTHATYTCSAGP